MKHIHISSIEEQAAEAYNTPPLGEDGRGFREACDGLTNYVCECNRAFNAETLHPLVSLIDMSSPCDRSRMKTDCYAVVFKHNAKDAGKYGRRPYDFTDGTLLFVTPRKAIDLETSDGKMLIFHPSLVSCTPLGARLKEYSFFKYRQDESLHISCCEEKVIKRCLGCIQDELCWGVDEYSKDIISNAIDLLLGYCRRFYNRQFITRHNVNIDAISTLDGTIDGYLKSGQAATKGLPTTSFFAQRLDMSSEYLNDMLKNETGKNVSEYVQLRRLSMAKQLLMAGKMAVSEISDTLGFSSPACFAAVFKKTTGCTPEEYRGNE